MEQTEPRVTGVWARLVGAIVVFAVPLLLFVALARDVADGGILPFDEPVMLWLHGLATPWLTAVTEVVTETGGLIVVPVVAAAGAAILWWRGRRWAATFVAAAVIGATLLNTGLKAVFRRSRPEYWEHLVVETSYSFPSGHAMASMSLGATLVVLVWSRTVGTSTVLSSTVLSGRVPSRTVPSRTVPSGRVPSGTTNSRRLRRRAATIAVAGLYVLVVGVTRMYLGVHYPSDVLAGWCVAVLWVAVVAAVIRRARPRARGPEPAALRPWR